jgi:transcriptional regulator with XRE-family HTH domain
MIRPKQDSSMNTPQDPLLVRIGTNLRALREGRGWTREKLAATTDIEAQMIKRIESGRANPALVVLSRLASALMISLSMMFAAEAPAAIVPDMPAAEAAEAFEADAVGETIASLRKQRRMSRRELARTVALRTGTLQRYESGAADARVLSIEPIARALSIDTVELVREIERRQRGVDLSTGEWSEHAPGVQFRLVSSAGRTQLWEWRLAAGTAVDEAPEIGVTEEIATTIRGTVVVETGGERHVLRRGGSTAVPAERPRRFVNEGRPTARLLRFQVRN